MFAHIEKKDRPNKTGPRAYKAIYTGECRRTKGNIIVHPIVPKPPRRPQPGSCPVPACRAFQKYFAASRRRCAWPSRRRPATYPRLYLLRPWCVDGCPLFQHGGSTACARRGSNAVAARRRFVVAVPAPFCCLPNWRTSRAGEWVSGPDSMLREDSEGAENRAG